MLCLLPSASTESIHTVIHIDLSANRDITISLSVSLQLSSPTVCTTNTVNMSTQRHILIISFVQFMPDDKCDAHRKSYSCIDEIDNCDSARFALALRRGCACVCVRGSRLMAASAFEVRAVQFGN